MSDAPHCDASIQVTSTGGQSCHTVAVATHDSWLLQQPQHMHSSRAAKGVARQEGAGARGAREAPPRSCLAPRSPEPPTQQPKAKSQNPESKRPPPSPGDAPLFDTHLEVLRVMPEAPMPRFPGRELVLPTRMRICASPAQGISRALQRATAVSIALPCEAFDE